MVSSTWRIEDPGGSGARSGPPLVSLRYLMDALRRRWRTWVGLGVCGMLLGLTYVVVVPPPSEGTVTIMLAHEEGTDAAVAMATDVGLLRTRTVAKAVVEKLNLPMTPEAFQRTITPVPSTTSILELVVKAPTPAAARERATALAESFLAFRNSAVRARSDELIRGYEARQSILQDRKTTLTQEYDRLVTGGPEAQTRATEVLTERSQVDAEIGGLDAQIEDVDLKASALVAASRVVDSPAVVPASGLRRTVLVVGTATVGGLAVGVSLVLFLALTSDRLRRRDEVALALGVPVRASARGTHRSRLPRMPWQRKEEEVDVAVLAHALSTALPAESSPSPRRLLLASVESIEDGEVVVATLAADLTAQGWTVLLVDLGENGGLSTQLVKALRNSDAALTTAPIVLRPEGVPDLATGPYGVPAGTTGIVADDDPRRLAWEDADVVLVLTSVRLGSDLDLLASWADDAVVLVAAGRSSAERLTTSAGLLRGAGLRLPFALMVGSDEYDESLGLPDEPGTGEGIGRREAR